MLNRRTQDAVQRLTRAAQVTGLEPPLPVTGGDADLQAIEAAIAPLRLPAELRALWRLLQPHSVHLTPYPALTDPAFALQCWREHLDLPGTTPRLLFPLAYESHGFLLVELDDERLAGGAVFSWGYCGSPYTLQHASVSDYLHQLAQVWEQRDYEQAQLPDGSTHRNVDNRPFQQRAAELLAAGPPHPVYGRQTEFDERPAQWPEHWLAAEGITPGDRQPKGRTAFIGELGQAGPGAPVEGTIHALVTRVAIGSAGARATVDDGTGVLDLWCPASVTMFGPVFNQRFEFDVTVDRHQSPADPTAQANIRAAVQDAASRRDLQGAQQAAAELHRQSFGTPATARATAVRTLAH